LIELSCFQDKSISGFISYALCAADEALRDANWLPSEDEKKEITVPSIFCGSAFSFFIYVILSSGSD
jgi:3-oxoacyl-(acyl-carrier-protein) synthase